MPRMDSSVGYAQAQKDDAEHVIDPTAQGHTLCGQPVYRVWNTRKLSDARPDGWEGCWTCLQKAEDIDKGMAAYLRGGAR